MTPFNIAYDAYLKYCKNGVLKLSSYLDRITIFNSFICPIFATTNIEDITKEDLKNWQTGLDKYSYKYKSKIRGFMFNFLKFCEYEYGIVNQLKFVWAFSKDKYKKKTKFNIYSENEYLRLMAKIDNLEDKTIFNLLYLCQLRKGELCALTWNDYLKNKKFLDVNKTFSRVNNYVDETAIKSYESKIINYYITGKVVYILQTPKSANSLRQVALPKSSIDLLDALYKEHKQRDNFSVNDFIFGKQNSFLKYSTLTNRFEKYQKRARLKKIRLHDLRHSGVSYLINSYSGEFSKNSLHLAYVIAERIGDTVEQVLLTYGHLFGDEQLNLINDIDI
ncbi:MAG: site-specific integrase [Clostridia bacterium]|nr:site-specific integrase [Clostridia bacterium]